LFSHKALEEIIASTHPEKVAELSSLFGALPVYQSVVHGKKILFYMTYMGSALSGTLIQEVHCLTGVSKFVMFGTCGCLVKGLPAGTVLVPTEAYQDEGFSYHYTPLKDYIPVKNHALVASFLKKKGLLVQEGRTWTTDAFYKETPSEIKKRKEEGCLSVEMECAGCEAVCDYFLWDFYQWLFTDDTVDGCQWDIGAMGSAFTKNNHLRSFALALEFASTL
jgi:uridine phosphorylase